MLQILTRHIIIFIYCCLPIVMFGQVEGKFVVNQERPFHEWKRNIDKIRLIEPDSAIQIYTRLQAHYLQQKDTLSAVNSLMEKAIVYGHLGQYQSAYDILWKALLLADKGNNEAAKIVTYTHLGRYSSFYKRQEESINYIKQALENAKKEVAAGRLKENYLVLCYYTLASTYQDLGNPQLARSYLDSCYIYRKSGMSEYDQNFIKVQSAILKHQEGHHLVAYQEMIDLEPWFEQNNPGFFVIVWTHMGDMQLAMGNPDSAIEYYKNALAKSVEYKSHIDFTPIIHEKLANLHLKRGNYQQAFFALQEEKKLNMKFFDSRSENNRSLLEIKDEYRKVKEEQIALLQEQKLAQLEQERHIDFLKNTLLLVSIIFILFASFLFFRYLRNKHKNEKQLIRKKRELEIQQANELLELKNKELATSTLKLIEKDEVLADLKEKISQKKGDVSAHDLKKIVRSISNSSASNWEEFEKRFISVNKDFYQKLNAKFPKLSRGDQKLCSLIKLNLSSKEMAKLLGISVESVHTNRYRLRKKLGLTRETSLTEFVARL